MSRAFSRAAGDYIEFNAGALSSFNGGNQTIVVLWKPDTQAEHGLFVARNAAATNAFGANPYLDNLIYYSTAGFVASSTWAAGTWYLTAISKGAGSSPVRVDTYDYTAAAWTSTTYGSLGDSGNTPIATMRLGWFGPADVLNGKIAAAAGFSGPLTYPQVQGMTTSLGSWLALAPKWCVALDQASVATPATDLTGGGGDQAAISGTAVSADEPPGWSYSSSVDMAATLTAGSTLTAGLTPEARLAAPLTGSASLSSALTTETRMASTLTAGSTLSATLTTATGPVDPIASPVAVELLACFTEQLQQLPNPPASIQLRVGQETGPLIGPNVDECCSGLAWVRVASVYPSWDSFPAADNTWLPCGPLAYAVVLELGIAFCMPWSDSEDAFDNQDPPSADDWQTAFNTQMTHQTLMRRTAACCFRPTQRRAVGEWTPLPVEGGCTGGKLTLTVSVPAPCADC